MVNAVVGLAPVLVFLGVLVSLDSFKLVPLARVLRFVLAGAGGAFVGWTLHTFLLAHHLVSETRLVHFIAPVTEETLKAIPVAYLVLRRRVGFLVDAAILGFAVGAGFALVENVEYLRAIHESHVSLWIVRGFGTAVLHGGTTAILAIVAKALDSRRATAALVALLSGLGVAVAIHSLFNQFVLPPVVATLVLFVTLPFLLVGVFTLSERSTRRWLGDGFDSEVEMLQVTLQKHLEETRVGRYLQSLESRFDGTVVADMLCLVRIHLELGIRAKGVLLAREAGLTVPPDEEVRASLKELRYLERSIGRTGLLALAPVLPAGSRDVWGIHMLESDVG
jgi:protease PrsW